MNMNLHFDATRAPVLSSSAESPFTRDSYDALVGQVSGVPANKILDQMAPCLPETFVEFDRKRRGDALNLALYGWDPEEKVAIVQVRMAFRRRAKHFMSVRKDYVLVGHNENGTPFRHPISAHAIRGAINAGADPVETVRAAQRWMWSCTAQQLEAGRRQGDILIVPERGQPKGDLKEKGTEATLAETHVVRAERLVRIKGKRHLWALRPVVSHTKGEHRDTRAPLADNHGWYSVRVAATAEAWDYSVRMGD